MSDQEKAQRLLAYARKRMAFPEWVVVQAFVDGENCGDWVNDLLPSKPTYKEHLDQLAERFASDLK